MPFAKAPSLKSSTRVYAHPSGPLDGTLPSMDVADPVVAQIEARKAARLAVLEAKARLRRGEGVGGVGPREPAIPPSPPTYDISTPEGLREAAKEALIALRAIALAPLGSAGVTNQDRIAACAQLRLAAGVGKSEAKSVDDNGVSFRSFTREAPVLTDGARGPEEKRG